MRASADRVVPDASHLGMNSSIYLGGDGYGATKRWREKWHRFKAGAITNVRRCHQRFHCRPVRGRHGANTSIHGAEVFASETIASHERAWEIDASTPPVVADVAIDVRELHCVAQRRGALEHPRI